jgi:nitrate/TMAO reductase-like tetraheme cytochrome c subunit
MPGGHQYRPKPRVWYRTTWFAFLAVLGILAVLVVILVVPVWATSTPAYCSSCKATRQAGVELKASAHAKVSCTACHIAPGLSHQIKWRGREWLNVYADYLNVPRVANKGQRPGNAACLKCHSLSTIPSQANGVRMPHEVHVQLRNLTCADCHDAVAHPKNGQPGNAVSMAVCSMCHNKQGAPSDCAFCHVTPPSSQNTHPANYLKTHGAEALSGGEAACLRCHHDKAAFCDACHSNPTPDHFSGDWRYKHGATASKSEAPCLGCHDKQAFCEQCHRVSHPSDWSTSHGAVAAKSEGACNVCHPQAMCVRCHQQKGVKL